MTSMAAESMVWPTLLEARDPTHFVSASWGDLGWLMVQGITSQNMLICAGARPGRIDKCRQQATTTGRCSKDSNMAMGQY